MFIILVIILTIISVSLRLIASGAELSIAMASAKARFSKKSRNNSSSRLAKVGVGMSISFMKVTAFIISRIRDLLGFVGIHVFLFEIIILLIVIVSASTFTFILGDDSIYTGSSSVVRNEFSSSYSGAKVENISDDSWKSTDWVGKQVAAYASEVVTNPPNGTRLIYKQGDTDVGFADCSVFVCGVIEGSLNKTFSGVEAPKGYDFAKNKKSDLKEYRTTYSMRDVVNKKKDCIIGNTTSDIDKIRSGDILLRGEHVGIYVGTNESGEHIMVHASTHENPYCNGDVNLSDGKKLDVGFSKILKEYTIIRTSKLVGGN